MISLKDTVDDLYNFRDLYFESHPINAAVNFRQDLKNEMNKTIAKLQSAEEEAVKEDRAMYYYLLGKTYNVENEYNPKAEELLSKAVKLNPNLIDAWNNLGDSYFKKGDYIEAKNCFLNGLNKEKNKDSLRNLSIVLRKLTVSSKEEFIENINQGVKYAQDCLALDPNDGLSWYIMGNAFISAFFTIKQSAKTLSQAMDAYNRAEDDKLVRGNPDLYYNKAVALKFQEEYEKALCYFDKAHQYDPHWTAIEQIQENLMKYLTNVQDMIHSKGRVKHKKLQTLIKSIDPKKHLGPFDNLSENKANGDVKLTHVPLSQLRPGLNEQSVILGTVVCSVQNEELVPFTFCVVDAENECVAVTVYNLASGQGVIIGDVVAIAMPYLKEIDFTFKDKKFQYKSIRVSNPLLLAVNGKAFPPSKMSSMVMSTFSEADSKKEDSN